MFEKADGDCFDLDDECPDRIINQEEVYLVKPSPFDRGPEVDVAIIQ